MRNIKSIIIAALVLGLLASCAHVAKDDYPAPTCTTMSAIVQNGELAVGTAASMPPMNMTTKDGRIIGLDVDIAEIMARGMGVKLKLVPMKFSELLPALHAGKIDVILSNMTITPKRNLTTAFVGPYYISGKAFLTKKEAIAQAENVSSLNSAEISLTALKGSTSHAFVEAMLPDAKLLPSADYDEAVAMVLDDTVDALLADFPICIVSLMRYPDQDLVSLITPVTHEPIGIAMRGNDPLFINWMENFLRTLEDSGELERLKQLWFENPDWIKQLP